MLIILCIFAPCLTNLITFMEKFRALFYVEKSFEKFCSDNGLSIVILNDAVITASSEEEEFSSDFVVKLLNLVNSWNSMALFADKHITFKFGLSGICQRDFILTYLRIWFECDGLVSYKNYFFE